jgi:hypothetical protein
VVLYVRRFQASCGACWMAMKRTCPAAGETGLLTLQ